mgnify:FL=1
MSEWYAMIGEVGFPVAVTLILLYRIEAKLDQVIQSIEQLPRKITDIHYTG